MQKPKRNLLIVTSVGKFTPCVKYVFDLFARTHGYFCEFASIEASVSTTADVILVYSDTAIHAPGAEEKRPAIWVHDCGFFREGSASGFGAAVVPEKFDTLVKSARGNALATVSKRESDHAARVTSDIISAAFFLLSGYYEWASPIRDNDGRILSSHIPVLPETWDYPMVNNWFRQLDELIELVISGEMAAPEKPPAPPGRQTICLTHDVDLLRKYRPGRAAKNLIKSLTAPGEFGKAASQLKRAFDSTSPDPYGSFDAIYNIKDRVSAPSTWFFLGCGPGGRNGDYRPSDREVRDLYTRARTFGDEIALHGSWSATEDCKALASEKAAVEGAARTTVRGSRQHYLRFSNPETWKCAEGANLHYEATGGFPDRAGFKYGWSGCFHPFDLDQLKPLSILEIPLICMDVTLANYEKIPAELTLERMTNLLDASCDGVPGGAFVFLWHNIMGDREQYPGYFDTFEYFFSVASGCARFVTLSQLCDEYEAFV